MTSNFLMTQPNTSFNRLDLSYVFLPLALGSSATRSYFDYQYNDLSQKYAKYIYCSNPITTYYRINNKDLGQIFHPYKNFSNYTNINSSYSFWTGGCSISTDGKNAAFGIYGNSGVYYTENYGNSWSTTTISGPIYPRSLVSSSDGTKIFLTDSNVYQNLQIYYSNDSGKTFQLKGGSYASGSTPTFLVASDDGNIVIGICVSQYYAFVTTNFTATAPTWMRYTINTSIVNITGLAANYNCSVVYISSTPVGIYKSTDTGSTWTKVTSPGLPTGNTSWNSISMSKDAQIVACGRAGEVYVSRDGGSSFSQLSAAITSGFTWTSISVSNDGSAIAIGSSSSNIIYISYNSGVTWISYTHASTTYGSSSIAIQNKLNILCNWQIFCFNSIRDYITILYICCHCNI